MSIKWGNNTSSKAHFIQNSEVAFSNSPHKNMVDLYPIMTKIIQITDQIQIKDPDNGSGITDLGLRIYGSRTTDLDAESGIFCFKLDKKLCIQGNMYSVTQSLCNSSLGDVVLDSSIMVYGDEGSI